MNINGYAGWHMSDLYPYDGDDEESLEEGIFVMEDINVTDSEDKENEPMNSLWAKTPFGD